MSKPLPKVHSAEARTHKQIAISDSWHSRLEHTESHRLAETALLGQAAVFACSNRRLFRHLSRIYTNAPNQSIPMKVPLKHTRRRQLRAGCDVSVIISWTDEEGSEHYGNGKCVEFSEQGLRIELTQPIPHLAYVTLRLERMGLAVSAKVRHVRRKGLNCIIGLELREPLRARVLEALNEERNVLAS